MPVHTAAACHPPLNNHINRKHLTTLNHTHTHTHGRKLSYVPPLRTCLQVRQAIFNMIQSQAGSSGGLPPGTRWLDLFAGTGSVGLEALSRGCAEAHFIELDPWVCKKVREATGAVGGSWGKLGWGAGEGAVFGRRMDGRPVGVWTGMARRFQAGVVCRACCAATKSWSCACDVCACCQGGSGDSEQQPLRRQCGS